MPDPLVETWNIHDRINLYMLDAVPEEALATPLGPKFRPPIAIFSHIHNVRLMWLKAAAPELMQGLEKLDGETVGKPALRAALAASGKAVAEMLARCIAAGGKVKGFKPHVTAFVGYLISHESHHRGQIGWTLKGTGHALPQKTAYGLWEWGAR